MKTADFLNVHLLGAMHDYEAGNAAGTVAKLKACLTLMEQETDGRHVMAEHSAAREALRECHAAFRRREHGGVAESNLRHRLEEIFGMDWR